MAENRGHIKKGEVRNPKGRPKGSKNKYAVQDFLDEFEKVGFNPIASVVYLAMHAAEEATKLAAAKELLKYTAAQLKAVDLSVEGIVNLVKFEDRLKELE